MKKKLDIGFSTIDKVLMELEMYMPQMLEQGKLYTWIEKDAFYKLVDKFEKDIRKEVIKELLEDMKKCFWYGGSLATDELEKLLKSKV